MQVVKTPLRDADGKIIGLQAIFWDITQQRMAEEKIRKANAALAQSRRELSAKNLEMEDDLKMAREIQLTMLPQQYPAFPSDGPGSESAFQFTHRYLPTGSVGGDFFTISALSETRGGSVSVRRGRSRRAVGAGDGDDPSAGGGTETAGQEPGRLPDAN